MKRVRKGDLVVILKGKSKGHQGKVSRVFPDTSKVMVEGGAMVTCHVKPSVRCPEGGKIMKEMPIHLSNVAHIDPILKVPTRVGFRLENGKKCRYAKRSGELIDGGK